MVISSNSRSYRVGKFSRVVLATALVVSAECVALSAHAANNIYRAFYYDANGLLLQVENVNNLEIPKRKLENIASAAVPVPFVKPKDLPLITGKNLAMSKFAVIAVYYSFDGQEPGDGRPDIVAKPKKIEYLGFVKERTIADCVERQPGDSCLYPKRCHCAFGTCCCY